MASQSSNFTTFSNVSASSMSIGAQADWYWQNPSNATNNDGSDTVFGFYGGGAAPINPIGQSDVLDVRQIVTTIPSGATVDGIQVTVRAYHLFAGSYIISDAFLHLLKGGNVIQHPSPTLYTWNGSTETAQVYGGPTDKWGTTWTASDINGAGFGVSLGIGLILDPIGEPLTTPNANIDQVSVTIYYTSSGGAAQFLNFDNSGIASAQVVSSANKLSTIASINSTGITSIQSLGTNTLAAIYRINHLNIGSLQSLGSNTLRTSYSINSTGITSIPVSYTHLTLPTNREV